MLHRQLTGERIGFSILNIVLIEKQTILTVGNRLRMFIE